ncbi:MAG: hydroxyacylglutathione hydrolase [Micavibrio sp.]|nr:hydroxyacylglutathione hydrolase [Micavibrio sp.]
MKIDIIPVLQDNYCYILHFENGQCAVVDPGEAAPVIQHLEDQVLILDLIINTHHHSDHIGGNARLREKYDCKIAAPRKEADKIGNVDILLDEDHIFDFGSEKAEIIETPGHTLGAICLYYPESGVIFTGDTLFSLGCGRLFEGTPDMMWASLQKLVTLPDNVQIYPGHEYTKANAVFCLSHDPDNEDLIQRNQAIDLARAGNMPTIPVSMGTEKKTNVFLRAKNAKEFSSLRSAKDNA